MFYWIYDIPNWSLALGLCALTVAFACGSVLISRPLIRAWLGPQPAANDLVSYFVSAFGVFYGLMLGLIAVGTYETFAQVDGTVGEEAACLAALYNDASMYDEPVRSKLQGNLREYATVLVEKVWPDQRKGKLNELAGPYLQSFYRDLLQIELKSKAFENLHADSIQQLNKLLELRRKRINSVSTGLPATLHYVVVVGAVLNLLLCCIFSVDRLGLHLLLVGLLATFIGLVIFLIAAMDNPFRGEFSVSPDAFQNLLDGAMKIKK